MYFPYFIAYMTIGFAISLAVFFWALNRGQFRDQQRARFLPLDGAPAAKFLAKVKATCDKLGVEIIPNYIVGKAKGLEELLDEGYSAVFLGLGAGVPSFLGIKGENLAVALKAQSLRIVAPLPASFAGYLTGLAGERASGVLDSLIAGADEPTAVKAKP